MEKRLDIALSFEHISPNLSARRIIGLLLINMGLNLG